MGYSYPPTLTSTTSRGHSHRAISGLIALTLLTTLAGGGGVNAAYASTPITLADNTAVVLSTTGTLYRLNLTTQELTSGPTLNPVTARSSAIEAELNPGTIIELEGAALGELEEIRGFRIDPGSGVASALPTVYDKARPFTGITRTDAGSVYVAYSKMAASEIALLNPSTGVLSSPVLVTLASTGKRLGALASVGDTVYAFVSGEPRNVYSVNPGTGALTWEFSLATDLLVGEGVVAADSNSDGTLFILSNTSTSVPILYSITNPSSNTRVATRLGPLLQSGTPTTMDIQALAIATLLDSERPEPEPEPDPEPESRGPAPDPEEESEVPEPENPPVHNSGQNSPPRSSVAITTPPASPVLAPTGAAPMVATWLGVFLFLGGLAGLLVRRRPHRH